jgi:N-acetylglucosamine kinase-like BadF-type ATPase
VSSRTHAAGLVVGVDGGNSKTEVLVARTDGTVLGMSRVAGCADIYQAGSPEAAIGLVVGAIDEALDAAGARGAGTVDAGAFSMAGADWPEDIEFLTREFLDRRVASSVTVVNDAIGALFAGIPEGVGVVVATGTGTATGARGPTGETWHSSYWQRPQGATDLAEQALDAAYRAELGIDPPTSLTRRLPDALGLADLATVLHAMTARGLERPRISLLAAVLLDEAERGDPAALRVVRRHGRALGDYALAAARRVGIDLAEPFTLVLTGGVFRHAARPLREAFVERVRRSAPRARLVRGRYQPVVGALRLALGDTGRDSGAESRIDETLPQDARALDVRARRRRDAGA